MQWLQLRFLAPPVMLFSQLKNNIICIICYCRGSSASFDKSINNHIISQVSFLLASWRLRYHKFYLTDVIFLKLEENRVAVCESLYFPCLFSKINQRQLSWLVWHNICSQGHNCVKWLYKNIFRKKREVLYKTNFSQIIIKKVK